MRCFNKSDLSNLFSYCWLYIPLFTIITLERISTHSTYHVPFFPQTTSHSQTLEEEPPSYQTVEEGDTTIEMTQQSPNYSTQIDNEDSTAIEYREGRLQSNWSTFIGLLFWCTAPCVSYILLFTVRPNKLDTDAGCFITANMPFHYVALLSLNNDFQPLIANGLR